MLMSKGRRTFFIVMSEYQMSCTSPPLPRKDLMRRPLSVPSNVQRRTIMWLSPARVPLPTEMPWPCRHVISSIRTSFEPEWTATLSSPLSISQLRITMRVPAGSIASVLGASLGAKTRTFSISMSDPEGTR
jgi:hypothetical protein